MPQNKIKISGHEVALSDFAFAILGFVLLASLAALVLDRDFRNWISCDILSRQHCPKPKPVEGPKKKVLGRADGRLATEGNSGTESQPSKQVPSTFSPKTPTLEELFGPSKSEVPK